MRLISRTQAKDAGMRTFFTGVPCKHGHIAERLVTSYRCTICKREWEKQRRQEHPEADKAMRQREVRKNRDAYNRRFQTYAHRKGPEYLSKQRKQYRQNNKARVLETCRARSARKIQATPRWYDKEACIALYEEAARLTSVTGIIHQVDHIIPLAGDNVCGLHCQDNLQILTKAENQTKSNKLLEHNA